jgi:hypothetical protein
MISAPPSVPRFSDARVTRRWGVGLMLPLFVLTVAGAILLPRPEPALVVSLVGAGAIVTAAAVGLIRSRVPIPEPVP